MTASPSAEVNEVPPHVRPEQVYSFDIYYDKRLLEDLQLGYRALQLEAPEIFYTPLNGGHWMVTRNALVQAVLKDPANFSNEELEIPKTMSHHKQIPINLDPPEHTPYRMMLMRHFTGKAIANYEGLMTHWARTLIDRVYQDGRVEFTEDLGAAFPVHVFMEILGLPLDRLTRFRAIVTEFFSHIPKSRRIELQDEIAAEMNEVVEARTQQRRDDLISRLINEDIGGRALTRDELIAICFLLFVAGLDTVANMMSFTFHFLAKNPDMQDQLRTDPSSVPRFVDEALRRFPITNGVRLIRNDIELAGANLKKGEMIVSPMSVANLDDRLNPDPETFDIDRTRRQHITFSVGPHLCLGHYLARSEMQLFVHEFLARIPRFRLPEGYRPKYRAGVVMALENLVIEWDVEQASQAA